MSGLQSIDPATGEVLWEGASASAQEVRAAVSRARAAFPGWAMLPQAVRTEHVRAFAAALKAPIASEPFG